MKWLGQVVQYFVIYMLGAVASLKRLFEIILEKWMVCDTVECVGACSIMVLTENVIGSA